MDAGEEDMKKRGDGVAEISYATLERVSSMWTSGLQENMWTSGLQETPLEIYLWFTDWKATCQTTKNFVQYDHKKRRIGRNIEINEWKVQTWHEKHGTKTLRA